MLWNHILLIALIQGITEWLPISSSAHLALLPTLTGLPDQGQAIDAAAHLGTLLAVLIWFRRDLLAATSGLTQLIKTGNASSPQSRLAMNLILATPPALLAGIALELTDASSFLRDVRVIAVANIGFAVILLLADKWGKNYGNIGNMTAKTAIGIGLAQMLALIPGASRSGVTMTAARMFGLKRTEAARFSMLAGAPILAAAGGYACIKLLLAPETADISLRDGIVVAILSFLAAMVSIGVLLAMLKRIGFLPFVLYRLLLGTALLIWIA